LPTGSRYPGPTRRTITGDANNNGVVTVRYRAIAGAFGWVALLAAAALVVARRRR